MYEIKDSGNREEFPTGSKRDVQTGKPRYELIPIEPLYDLAMHYTNGAVKYGDENWRKGQPIKRMFASLLRHTYAYLAGVNDGEDHGSAIAWNAFAIKWTRLQIKAGLLPWELEDVFTDEQFLEFYGQPRDRIIPLTKPDEIGRSFIRDVVPEIDRLLSRVSEDTMKKFGFHIENQAGEKVWVKYRS